jgi:hypothetical protein
VGGDGVLNRGPRSVPGVGRIARSGSRPIAGTHTIRTSDALYCGTGSEAFAIQHGMSDAAASLLSLPLMFMWLQQDFSVDVEHVASPEIGTAHANRGTACGPMRLNASAKTSTVRIEVSV